MGVGKKTFQSAGQISQHLIPGAFSRIDSVKGAAGFASVNRGVIMGKCTGGKPATLLQFNTIAEAVVALRTGPLAEAVRLAFNPGNDLVPQRLFAMRVNTATPALIDLEDGVVPTPMIRVNSLGYGLWNNQITVQVANATVLLTNGKKVTIAYQNQPNEVFDEIRRQSFTIEYVTGACTLTIVNHSTAKTLVTSAGGISITLTDYPTIGELAAYINAQTGFTCTAIAGQENASSSELDGVAGLDINTAEKTVESTMEAIIDAINIGSARVSAVPANAMSVTLATFLVGGIITINGVAFTAHVDTTTVADREFDISGADTADAVELCICINDATYGVPGVDATNVAGVVVLSPTPAEEKTITVTSVPDDATCVKTGVTRTIPPNAGPLYLASGTEGSYTSSEWTAALVALEAEDVQFVATSDALAAPHAAIKAHCAAMSAVTGRKERQFLLGAPWKAGAVVATEITNAKSAAAVLNSKYGMYVLNGGTQYDVNGVLANFGGSYAGCMLLGMACTVAINMPLTFKTLNFVELEWKFSDSQLEDLIGNGVCPINYNNNGVPHCVRQIQTYLTEDLKWNEFSTTKEMLFCSRDLRSYLEALFVGKPGTALTKGVLRGAVEARLESYKELGVFITDPTTGKAWWNVVITISGDVVYVDYDAYLTAPVNFIFVTNHFHTLISTT